MFDENQRLGNKKCSINGENSSGVDIIAVKQTNYQLPTVTSKQ